MSDEICIWSGFSGASYLYYVYERHPDVPSRMGNFVYTLKNQQGHWAPVYMGQGDLSIRSNNDPEIIECINARGATHVHLRLNSLEQDRLDEIEDMLELYRNAFVPYGCHPRQRR